MFSDYKTEYTIYTDFQSPIVNHMYYGGGKQFNYKENPVITIKTRDEFYYCNPPIAFNEYLTISTPTFDRNGYTYCLVLYKPK